MNNGTWEVRPFTDNFKTRSSLCPDPVHQRCWIGKGRGHSVQEGGGPRGGYLLQAALKYSPLHIPGSLVAGILLLQTEPRMLIFPQLRAEVLQQGLEGPEQLLIFRHLWEQSQGNLT